MASIAYPGKVDHQRYHQEFLRRFEHLRMAVERSEDGANAALFSFMSSWLKEHIFKADKAFVEFARQQGKLTDIAA